MNQQRQEPEKDSIARPGMRFKSPLTFDEFSAVSRERSKVWHKGTHWSVVDWSNALAGEAGEVCNAVKKLRRLEDGMVQSKGPKTREQAVQDIADEIGDVYAYLDLLAEHLGLRMADCVRHKFNEVSERENFPQRVRED